MTIETFTLDHFGSNRFALVQERSQEDVIQDYHPGYWGIETQKKAIEVGRVFHYAGHKITAGMGDQRKIARMLKKITTSYSD